MSSNSLRRTPRMNRVRARAFLRTVASLPLVLLVGVALEVLLELVLLRSAVKVAGVGRRNGDGSHRVLLTDQCCGS